MQLTKLKEAIDDLREPEAGEVRWDGLQYRPRPSEGSQRCRLGANTDIMWSAVLFSIH